MKIFLQIAILLSLTMNLHATILRCNNTPGMQGVYPTFSSAVNAAQLGDTIHLEPSGIPFDSNYVLTKSNLTIIGNGFDLFANQQADTISSYMKRLRVQAKNVKIISCRFRELNLDKDSCSVLRSSFLCFRVNSGSGIFEDTIKDILVESCFMPVGSTEDSLTNNTDIFQVTKVYNFLATNNFIGKRINMLTSNTFPFVFRNNVFADTTVVPAYSLSKFFKCILENNIFKSGTYTVDSSIMTNNVVCNESNVQYINGTINNNYPNESVANAFANPLSGKDDDQVLLPSFSHQDVGMFAGTTPYKLGGLAPIPIIYQFNVPNVINSNTGTIIISTRSNQ